jgi:hypothetical protein
MTGFLSFLFLLLVIWLLLHCIHMFLRLIGESLFPGSAGRSGVTVKRIQAGVSRPCPNPHCRKDNRGAARFCARCGQPLIPLSGLQIDHAC